MTDVKIGTDQREIDEFSVYKATIVLDRLGRLTDAVPGIFEARARYRQRYIAENAITLDRVAARRRYAPVPLHREVPLEQNGELVRAGDGELVFVNEPLVDEQGAPRLFDPLGHISEDDWRATENKLTLPGKAPTGWEEIGAVANDVVRVAKTEAFDLIAAVLTPSSEMERADDEGGDQAVDDAIAREAKRLKHRMTIAQAIEVLFAAGEAIGQQLGDQLGDIGGRLGKLQEGLGLTSTPDEPEIEPMAVESSRPASPTDSPSDSGGAESESSTAADSASSQPSPVG